MSGVSELDPRVAQAFYGRFAKLWPAQEAAIHSILSHENVLVSAGTGSGKTEAVLAPLVNLYWPEVAVSNSPAILYVAPTKALLNDVLRRIERPLSDLGLRSGIRHGDRSDVERADLPHVLLTTPESLDVLLFQKSPILGTVQALVLDEAHLLYNTQRGLQLSILVRRLRAQLAPRTLQWAALSATMSRPGDVKDFFFGQAEAARILSYSAGKPIDAHIRRVTQEQELVDLVRLMQAGRPTKLLMFVDSRKTCERVAGVLQRDCVSEGAVFAHYSSLSPEVRLETETRFAAERKAICVATSTLELGIDIGDIDAVVLWGPPPSVESFLQRIGRANRRTQRTCAVCIVPDDSETPLADYLAFLAVLQMARTGEIPWRENYELYGAMAQQCLDAVASEGARFVRVADLADLFLHKPYAPRERVEDILAQLEALGYLKKHGFQNRYGPAEPLYELVDYRLIYSNFPLRSQVTEVRWGGKVLGDVPAANLIRMRVGGDVRFAGKLWRVRKCTRDAIFVEPSRGGVDVTEFSYGGGGRGLDPAIVDRIREMLYSEANWADSMSRSANEELEQFRSELRRQSKDGSIPFTQGHGTYRYLTFAGRLVNKAVALFTKQPSHSAGDFYLETVTPVNWTSLPTEADSYKPLFPMLFEPTSDQTVFQQTLPDALQLVEFMQNWLRDPAIPRILARLAMSRPTAIGAELVERLSA